MRKIATFYVFTHYIPRCCGQRGREDFLPCAFFLLTYLRSRRQGGFYAKIGRPRFYRSRIRFMNSARVRASFLKRPRMALVIVELFCFCTPRIIMHR